jgi:hypothetical protein
MNKLTTSKYIGHTDTCDVAILRFEVFTVVVLKITVPWRLFMQLDRKAQTLLNNKQFLSSGWKLFISSKQEVTAKCW